MKTIETVGKDIEQALKAGLNELGCKLDDVDVKILEHPGIFRKARVRMIYHGDDETVEKKTAAAVMRNLEERAARVAGGNNDRGRRNDGRNKFDRRERADGAGDQRPQVRDAGRPNAAPRDNSAPREIRNNAPMKDRPVGDRQVKKPNEAEKPQRNEFRRDFRAELEAANGGNELKQGDNRRNERNERGERRKPEYARETVAPETLEAARVKIADYLVRLTELMGMPGGVKTEIRDNGVDATLTADNELLVGARGETLEALEYLATMAANGGESRQVRVNLDCNGYRKRLEGDLARSAVEAADKAAATGKRVEMPPMSSAGRRVVHAALSGREDVITRSEGRDPNRYIVIIPKRGDRNGAGAPGSYNGGRKPNVANNSGYKKNNNKHWNNHGRKNAGGKDSGAE